MATLVGLNAFEKFLGETLSCTISDSETELRLACRSVYLHKTTINLTTAVGLALLTELGLGAATDGTYQKTVDIRITKNDSLLLVVKIGDTQLTPEYEVMDNPANIIATAFGLRLLAVNGKNYFPVVLLKYPLNVKLLETHQYVLEKYGEAKLQEALKFWDQDTNPALERLMGQLGIADMVAAIKGDAAIDDITRGIVASIKTFLRIRGTNLALWYALYSGGAPINTDLKPESTKIVNWYDAAFLPLMPGGDVESLRGFIDIHIDPDEFNGDLGVLQARWTSVGEYLFPWYLQVYRWIFTRTFSDSRTLTRSDDFSMYRTSEARWGSFIMGFHKWGGADEDQVV